MYHECSNNGERVHVVSVHSYHDMASAALSSFPVISTNKDQRIQ